MDNDAPKDSREDALTPSQPDQVKTAGRLSPLTFIVADQAADDKRRGEVLAAVYRYILAEWGCNDAS